VIDEAHRFKNVDSARTLGLLGGDAFVKHFDRVVLLSGTPMPQRPFELYPILKRLAPEVIGFRNRIEYGLRYCGAYTDRLGRWVMNGEPLPERVEELFTKVKERFMVRIKKETALSTLPPRTEEVVILANDLPPKLAKLDAALSREWELPQLIEKARRGFRPEDRLGGYKPNAAMGELATYRREVGIQKISLVSDYVSNLLAPTDFNVIVFAIHKDVIAGLREKLKFWRPIVIDGDSAPIDRVVLADEFQTDPRRRLLIANIQAGGVGLNLTKADRVLFAEWSWVPGENSQAIDRAHRIGRTKPVVAQYLAIQNSMDRRILESNLKKRKLTEAL
jgi:SNF2 family DNA or RNA helicase